MFKSPGGASVVIIFEVSPRSGEGQKREQNDGGDAARALCASEIRMVEETKDLAPEAET